MQTQMSFIKRAAVWGNSASLAIVDCASVVNEIASRHGYTPEQTALLGEAVACALYYCSWIEKEERVSLVFDDGAGGKLVAGGGGDLRVYGAAQLNGAPWRYSEGKGFISLTLDRGKGMPFTGTCALVSGKIAENMSAYFETSEQRPTAIGLYHSNMRDIERFIGVFVQPLTGADESVLSRAKRAVADSAEKSTEEILNYFCADKVETRFASFGCSCSRAKAERAILSVGERNARAVLEQERKICVHCHDCNADYVFTDEDIEKLFRGTERTL